MGGPKKKPIAVSDTLHVKTTRGHEIVVKKGSGYAKQAKKRGAVLSSLRPLNLSKEKDPRSIENYNKRYGENSTGSMGGGSNAGVKQ